MKSILKRYEEASGQKVNLQNSAICLSQNIKRPAQNHLADTFSVDKVERHENLGFPIFVERNRGVCFNHIKECLWKKL